MHILKAEEAYQHGKGMVALTVRRPGMIWHNENQEDLAFGPLSRIDHAHLRKGVVIKMHEHRNDEIFSYMWKGKMLHKDSTGEEVVISPSKLMMMGAGKSFFHEEATPYEAVEMLQIIIRPEQEDLEPEVQFYERNVVVNGQWNVLAGPEYMDPPLRIRQQVAVFDLHGNAGDTVTVPTMENMTPWLYVMGGEVKIGNAALQKGDAATPENGEELDTITLTKDSTLVLFLVNLEAKMTFKGNFSGVKK